MNFLLFLCGVAAIIALLAYTTEGAFLRMMKEFIRDTVASACEFCHELADAAQGAKRSLVYLWNFNRRD